MKAKRLTEWEKGFTCGLGYAVALLRRLGHSDGASEQLLGESGIPLKDFKRAGVEPYDMVMIRKSAKARGIK
jgi:hypothetical protein